MEYNMGLIQIYMPKFIYYCRSELARENNHPVREQARSCRFEGEKGFTLIEIIMVIVLLGIIGAMGSDIIATSFKGFSDTDARMELFEEGKLAMMRMEREIRHMVPNAIDDPNNATTINFGVIDVNILNDNGLTGRYQPLGAADKIRDLSHNTLDGSLISIYNTNWTDFSSLTNRKIYRTTATGINMDLDKEIIGGHSASKRYYPVERIIRYSYDIPSGTLSRSQASVSEGGDLMAALNGQAAYPILTHINSLTFNYTPPSLTSNALVRINFTLTNLGNTLNFHKEIQVRNVP